MQEVERRLGVRLDPNGAPNRYGYTNRDTAQWWHAVDLVSSGHWRELIETADFTTPEHIAGAVCYGLDYSPADRATGHLSLAEARALLTAVDAPEPEDCAAILRRFDPPSPCWADGQRERWPINGGWQLDAAARAWARVYGITEGWLKYDRSGFLQWAKYGRDRYATGDEVFFTDTGSGQGGFAF